MLYICAYSHLLSFLYVCLSFYLKVPVLTVGLELGDSVKRRLTNESASKDVEQYVMQRTSKVFHYPSLHKKSLWTREFFTREKSSDRKLELLNALKSNIFLSVGHKRSPPRQQRVFLYGQDDRLTISSRQIKRYPYFNIVRLSVGCTGTLLTPSYVLTAAHCVHDGNAFRPNIEMLKVYIPHRHGDLVRYIRNVSVPSHWDKSSANSMPKRAAYDYAVLQLNIAVYGRRAFMPLHVPSQRLINEDLYFLGFHYDSLSMAKTKCSELLKIVVYNDNVLLSQCDSSVGNSGATLFYENPRTRGRKIIGLVSNTAIAMLNGDHWSRVTFITLLTMKKVRDICDMVYPEGEEYNVCPPYTYRHISGRPIVNRLLFHYTG